MRAGLIVLVVDLFLQVYLRSIRFGVVNLGVSLGFLGSLGGFLAIFVYLLFLGYFLYCLRSGKSIQTGLWFVMLGGTGNFLMRVLTGSVWDYILIGFLPFWFNLSDVLITLGVISYILQNNELAHIVRR